MRSQLKIALLFPCIFLMLISGQTQTRDSDKLKKQEKQLNEKIKETKKLIKLTRNSEQLTIAELAILNHQIAYREELVSNINYQMRKLTNQIEDVNVQILQIENNLQSLKDEYIKMLQYAYKNRNDEFELMYIFSSKSYEEAYYRMKYIEQYNYYRQQQIDKIENTKNLLQEKLALLEEAQAKKNLLMDEHEKEKTNYLSDKEEQQQALIKLKQNEQALQNDLNKQKQKKQELAKKINAAIQAEIKAASKAGNKGFQLTPEAAALGKTFNANKGKLPWPVAKGEITGKYGKHAHPTLAGIVIDNQGVIITTEKNAEVRAVFQGTVTSIINIPGAGRAVMIGHGSYKTVYSNLKEVYVSKGDKVDVKQKIGSLIPAANGTTSEAELQIWYVPNSTGVKTVNPESWIYKK